MRTKLITTVRQQALGGLALFVALGEHVLRRRHRLNRQP